MTAPWMQAPTDERRGLTDSERGLLLVDLLDLSDALPPPRRRPLDAPTFRQLCERS